MRYLYALLLSSFASLALAQSGTTETVQTLANNQNQVWYSLKDGVKNANNLADWDLGFQISGYQASVLFNNLTGNKLMVYPKGTKADWQAIDTNGMHSWKSLSNSDTSWLFGAFNRNMDLSNELDLGWGSYNMTNHQVQGDSIYIIKTADNTVYKLIIESLANSTYTFKYALLDGSNEKTGILKKGDFTGKNFGYYNLSAQSEVDLEPASNEWDLLFTKYMTQIPTGPSSFMDYPVVGVLANAGTHAYKIYPVETESYTDYSPAQGYSPINAIGYDWKKFDMNTMQYVIRDSLVYLVKTQSNEIWKVVFKSYGGATTGDITFEKNLLYSTGIENTHSNLLQIFPNPLAGQPLSIISQFAENGVLSIYNTNGQLQKTIRINAGFSQQQIDLGNLPKGMYMLHMQSANEHITKTLLVK
ncbi:T9SS type A sorting domain-containing protein [bacterium]|nr:T9SS type A sorting domain-containing protein [bacterium]